MTQNGIQSLRICTFKAMIAADRNCLIYIKINIPAHKTPFQTSRIPNVILANGNVMNTSTFQSN
jgi:hypothetical protein